MSFDLYIGAIGIGVICISYIWLFIVYNEIKLPKFKKKFKIEKQIEIKKRKVKSINRIDDDHPEIRKHCGICIYWDGWFGDCFCEEDTGKNPLNYDFQGDNFGNAGGICRLYKFRE